MRVLLSKDSKKELYDFLKVRYNCTSGRLLADALNMPYSTLKNWFQEEERYIPIKFIPEEIFNKLELLDNKDDNLGRIKGGKKTYRIILDKYGYKEIKRRQSNGGKKAIKLLFQKRKNDQFIIDIKNSLFLEFYGALLGDGWLSKLRYKNKIIHLIGISGHKILDKEFHIYCKNNISILFNRNPYLKELKSCNERELLFSHKNLHKFLNECFGFPIGLKKNLKLKKDIIDMGYDKIKYIIRGIFDTYGSFYLDKTPAGRPYPCISIAMKESILMQ